MQRKMETALRARLLTTSERSSSLIMFVPDDEFVNITLTEMFDISNKALLLAHLQREAIYDRHVGQLVPGTNLVLLKSSKLGTYDFVKYKSGVSVDGVPILREARGEDDVPRVTIDGLLLSDQQNFNLRKEFGALQPEEKELDKFGEMSFLDFHESIWDVLEHTYEMGVRRIAFFFEKVMYDDTSSFERLLQYGPLTIAMTSDWFYEQIPELLEITIEDLENILSSEEVMKQIAQNHYITGPADDNRRFEVRYDKDWKAISIDGISVFNHIYLGNGVWFAAIDGLVLTPEQQNLFK